MKTELLTDMKKTLPARFTMEEVLSSAEAAGLTYTATYDAFSHDAPKDDSERLYFVFKR